MNRANFIKGLGALLIAPSAAKLTRLGDDAQTVKLRDGVVWNQRQFRGVTFEGPATIHMIDGEGSLAHSVLRRSTQRDRSRRVIRAHGCQFDECQFDDVIIVIGPALPRGDAGVMVWSGAA